MTKLKHKQILSLLSLSYIILAVSFHFEGFRNAFHPLYRVWEFCGFNQSWRLFSPDVPTEGTYISGLITMNNGTVIMWEPPRPARHSFNAKLEYDRFVKWETDFLPWEIYKPHLPQLCNHVCAEFDFGNSHPVSCALITHSFEFSDPRKRFLQRKQYRSNWSQCGLYRQFYPCSMK